MAKRTGAATRRVGGLLRQIVRGFPAARREMERAAARYGVKLDAELVVAPPVEVSEVPTFSPRVARPVSPMLRERFAFASTIAYAGKRWLGAAEMAKAVRSRSVRATHRSLREHWEGSAPARFADDRLGLYAVTPGLPDAIVYLVWPGDAGEPELWAYSGMDATRYDNLAAYLEWHLGQAAAEGEVESIALPGDERCHLALRIGGAPMAEAITVAKLKGWWLRPIDASE